MRHLSFLAIACRHAGLVVAYDYDDYDDDDSDSGTCKDVVGMSMSKAVTFGVFIPLLVIWDLLAICCFRRGLESQLRADDLLAEARERAKAGDRQAIRDVSSYVRNKAMCIIVFHLLVNIAIVWQIAVTGCCADPWTAFGIAAPICIAVGFCAAGCGRRIAKNIATPELRDAVEEQARENEKVARDGVKLVKAVTKLHGVAVELGSMPDSDASQAVELATKGAEKLQEGAEKYHDDAEDGTCPKGGRHTLKGCAKGSACRKCGRKAGFGEMRCSKCDQCHDCCQ